MHDNWDTVRESLIFITVFLLFYPAYKTRSYLTGVILVIILAQHSVQLLGHAGFLSAPVVKAGALTLAITGAYHQSAPILFAGTYSFLSKFEYIPYQPRDNEIAKFVISVAVFLAIYAGTLVTKRIYSACYPRGKYQTIVQDTGIQLAPISPIEIV